MRTGPWRDITSLESAQSVYNALRKAYTKHTTHLAHFCIEVEEVSKAGTPIPEVRFKMAFASSTSQLDPIWLVVDAVISEATEETSEPSYALIRLENYLKRAIDSHADQCERKTKESVRFELSIEKDSHPNIVPNPFSLDSRLSLDFCDYLRRCFRQRGRLR
jgi:hypothetical protein